MCLKDTETFVPNLWARCMCGTLHGFKAPFVEDREMQEAYQQSRTKGIWSLKGGVEFDKWLSL